MTTQHDKAKRWQFGLKRLLVIATVAPVVIGLASGALDVAVQYVFLAVVVTLFWVGFMLLLVGSVLLLKSGLMFLTGNSDGFLARASERDGQ